MIHVDVVARLVDDSELPFEVDGDAFLSRFAQLDRAGCHGRALVDQLLTDDWPAPPLCVQVSWIGADGRSVERVLPYD